MKDRYFFLDSLKTLYKNPKSEENKTLSTFYNKLQWLMNELKTIGNYLTEQSVGILQDGKLKDAFIRSAYNRYYSCYLRVRIMIKEVLGCDLQMHALTQKKIKKIYNDAEEKHKKNINDDEIKRHLESLNDECEGFCRLMDEAKKTREYADYYWGGEKEYEERKNELNERNISVTKAENWLTKVEEYIYSIKQIRNNLGY